MPRGPLRTLMKNPQRSLMQTMAFIKQFASNAFIKMAKAVLSNYFGNTLLFSAELGAIFHLFSDILKNSIKPIYP